MRSVMASLAAAGHDRIHLWVTAGNTPAERIYDRPGYVDAPPREPAEPNAPRNVEAGPVASTS